MVRDYPEKSIDFRRNQEWVSISKGLVQTYSDQRLDLAVLEMPNEPIYEDSAPQYGSAGLMWGQDIFICGFPTVDDYPLPGSVLPTPHIRKGILSAIEARIYAPNFVWMVDALIESGYSGGHAVFVNKANVRQVIGIVKSIKSTSDIYAVEDTDMKDVEGLFYRRQSGIVEVVDLACLKDLGILNLAD